MNGTMRQAGRGPYEHGDAAARAATREAAAGTRRTSSVRRAGATRAVAATQAHGTRPADLPGRARAPGPRPEGTSRP